MSEAPYNNRSVSHHGDEPDHRRRDDDDHDMNSKNGEGYSTNSTHRSRGYPTSNSSSMTGRLGDFFPDGHPENPEPSFSVIRSLTPS